MIEAPSVLPAIPELGLSGQDLIALGNLLESENNNYNCLLRAGVCTVGTNIEPNVLYTPRIADKEDRVSTHTSFLLQNTLRWGEIMKIHFRENLDFLKNCKTEWERRKKFLGALPPDLDCLAQTLVGLRRRLRMVIGLATLPAAWGQKHG